MTVADGVTVILFSGQAVEVWGGAKHRHVSREQEMPPREQRSKHGQGLKQKLFFDFSVFGNEVSYKTEY